VKCRTGPRNKGLSWKIQDGWSPLEKRLQSTSYCNSNTVQDSATVSQWELCQTYAQQWLQDRLEHKIMIVELTTADVWAFGVHIW